MSDHTLVLATLKPYGCQRNPSHLHRSLAVPLLTLLTIRTARADVVFDAYRNLALPCADGANNARSPVGFAFLLPAGLTPLTPSVSLDLGLASAKPIGSGSAVVSIAEDSGSFPAPAPGSGTVIGSIADSGLSTTFVLQTFSFSPSVLQGGADGEYWVLVTFTAGSIGELALSDVNPVGFGLNAQEDDVYSAGNAVAYGDSGGAYEAIVDTPAPAAIALLGGAMAGLGCVRRRVAREA